MSELINNSMFRRRKLKELILKLHQGSSAQEVQEELLNVLGQVPYGEVVEVEQELIQEGLPESEIIRLCDIHGQVLHGHVDLVSAREVPEGHPVDVFKQENRELLKVIERAQKLLADATSLSGDDFKEQILRLISSFNELMDVDKHYRRKEYLLFPYLEKNEITGPPKVMWAKHDEIREQLKGCLEILRTAGLQTTDLADAMPLLFRPTLQAIADMTRKEEEILLPMSMDILTTDDWWQIHKQTLDFGFTLYDPQVEWRPEGLHDAQAFSEGVFNKDGGIQLPSGSLTAEEVMAIHNTIPFDMTFVDKNDKVKYFTQARERIFDRSRSIINRDVRLCHPPGSVHIIEKILEDFKSGKASRAPFWIQMRGKFIHIEYFALRDRNGQYLGTLEVSQDLTDLQKLEGEQRILSYSEPEPEHA